MPRTTIVLTGPALEALETMRVELGASVEEVVMDALALMSFAIEQTKHSQCIGGFDPATRHFTKISTPSLATARLASLKRP